MRMLVWVPSIVVVRVGSEDTMSPFRLQVMERGLSPLVTAHISWAESPWFTGNSPNEKGVIVGGSRKRFV